MGFTNFPNGVTSMGIPLLGSGGIPATKGNVYFVDYGSGSDGNPGTEISKPFKTLLFAYNQTTTNNDDVIVLMGSTTHTLTAMLSVTKNRVHFVGMDGTNRYYGQNAKVSLGVTTAAGDIGTIQNTGVRNSFHNIKFINSNTVAQGIYCFVEAGEYTVIENCEIYKSTDLNETTAAEMVMNGDSSIVRNCTIGSNADALTGAIIHPNVLVSRTIVSGKVCRDVTFENCLFWRKASHINNRFIYGSGATDVERMLWIKNCLFFATKLSAAIPAQCVAFGSAQTEGYALIDNCTGINVTALSTTAGALITGAVPTYATSGIAVAS